MVDKITVEVEGLDIKSFTFLYAQAILEAYLSYGATKKAIEKKLSEDTDRVVQEVKVHRDGEIHIYFYDGTHLEYSKKELTVGG